MYWRLEQHLFVVCVSVLNMAISKSEIRSIAQQFLHESREERANQCGRLMKIIQMELDDHPNVKRHPVPQTGEISYSGDSVGHCFVTLAETEVEEASAGPVVIDPTIQQFCKSNYEKGLVKLEVESFIDLPEHIGIFTPNDKGFQLYEF